MSLIRTKMELETISLSESPEREEGEILDDDLEAISDDSLIVPFKGKLDSYKESLRALSLSSVSDNDELREDLIEEDLNTNKISKSRKNLKGSKRKKVKKRRFSSGSSEDGVVVSKKLLHEAIRVETPDEKSRKSLRTRLKKMQNPEPLELITQVDTETKKDDVSNNVSNKPVIEEVNTEEDNELIQLRLEALKTAILNKYKYKKNIEANNVPEDINKENSPDKNIIESTKSENKVPDKPINTPTNEFTSKDELDEDEDILRAVLLASMSKKMTTDASKSIKKPVQIVQEFKNPPNQLSKPKMFTLPTVQMPKNFQVPKVKPLIINVDSSESDDDLFYKKSKDNKEKINSGIQLHVENFLKEQHAKVETLKNVDKSKTPIKKKEIIMPKSVVKLLPKNKQIEYQRLLLRIRNAEKPLGKAPVLQSSSKSSVTVKTTPKKFLRVKNFAALNNVEVKSSNNVINKTFKDVQERQNGRLQIKGKYRTLAPIMKKINEASEQREKLEIHIKNLISQLKEARLQCQNSQQSFNLLMNEFITKKNEIDKRVIDDKSKFKLTNNDNLKKTVSKEDNIEKSIQSSSDKRIVNTPENLTDPSDIIFKKADAEIEKNGMSKYISPLNTNSCSVADPLGIMCPFEINGSCRDDECNYNHVR